MLAVLLVLAVRRAPAGALAGLAHANPGLLVASVAVFLASHAFRAARLNLLLPAGSRVPPLRAFGLSGASHLLVQVVPFRGGDVASLALLRRELGATWSRSSGVFVLVKLVDTAAAFLVGLAGGTAILLARRFEGGAWGAALLVALALALAVLPSGGGVVLDAVSARAGRWPRLERVLLEAGKGLAVARSRPSAYAAACVLSVAFLGAHLRRTEARDGGPRARRVVRDARVRDARGDGRRRRRSVARGHVRHGRVGVDRGARAGRRAARGRRRERRRRAPPRDRRGGLAALFVLAEPEASSPSRARRGRPTRGRARARACG